VSLWPRQALF